jgi:ferredoxin
MAKVKVISDACIGCGACTAYAPTIFELGDDGKAIVVSEPSGDDEASLKEAIDSCPNEAIVVE